MESNTELAKSIQNAMRAKHLTRDQLAETLGTSHFMIEKLLSGDVVPSTHLEKKLIEGESQSKPIYPKRDDRVEV